MMIMNRSWRRPRHWSVGFFPGVTLVLFALSVAPAPAVTNSIHWWVSSADRKQQLAEQPALKWRAGADAQGPRIEINPTVTFQTMLGLGSSLEPTTCSNLWAMSAADRADTIERVVSPSVGIGMNLMRVCIGTPDFTGDPWYSYNDLATGETDPELKRFSIEKDRAYILPVLKLARAKNPDLLFFASPWSPPGWMKRNGTMIGGELLPQWYAVYAEYFVKFIRAYEAEGVPIYAVTVQNEPGVDRAKEKNPKWHYPSCHWTGEQERDFIRDHLGPALRRAGLKTKIWCYDHNYNLKTTGADPGLDYPRAILRDAAAAAFVDGVAFHGYEGKPSAMSVFHEEFPKVPLHFSEGSVFGVEGAVDLIERLRNWATSYNAWVLMLDDHGKPQQRPVRGFSRNGGVEYPDAQAGVSTRLSSLRTVHEVHPARRRAGGEPKPRRRAGPRRVPHARSLFHPGCGESRCRGTPVRDPLAGTELCCGVAGEERGHLAVGWGVTLEKPPEKNFWRGLAPCRTLPVKFRGPSPLGMKAKIIITPKKAVLDPQGKTVQSALEHMGYTGVTGVHVGKYIEIDLAPGTDRAAAQTALNDAALKFLSNPIIEDYRLEIE